MVKRKFIIPKTVTLKCPFCEKKSRIAMPKESFYAFECKKCKKKLEVPQSRCCLICAYSDKKCTPQLIREAMVKGLELKSEYF